MPRSPSPDRSEDGPVPLFGTWGAAYAAVIACALLTLLFLFLFERGSF